MKPGARKLSHWLRQCYAPQTMIWLALLVGTALSSLVVYVIIQRFRFPLQLEWMSGGVYDHVDRVRAGKPLYAAPSLAYVPFIYPPLLYWLSAPLVGKFGAAIGCRIVTTTCTVIVATMAIAIARTLRAGKLHAVLAGLLYLAAYPVSGYWYDLERADSVMMALVAVATWLLLRWNRAPVAALAGVLCGIALFAKQPTVLFVFAFAVGLAAVRAFRRLGAYLLGFFVSAVPLYIYLQSTSGGWFHYYCWKMPSMHGIRTELLPLFFVTDAGKAIPFVGITFAWLFYVARLFLAPGAVRERLVADVLFGCALMAGYVAAMSGRLHAGGYLNVLMFWTTFAAVALAVAASRATTSLLKNEGRRGFATVVQAAPLLALVQFGFDPGDASPTAQRVVDAQIVEHRVREIESEGRGEVVVQGRGNLTKQPHFHIMALADVLRAGQEIPPDLRAGFEKRSFAAYIIDEPGELYLEGILGKKSELGDLILRNYFIAERFDDREPPPVVGWIAHPTWVLRPRLLPSTQDTPEQLQRRMTIEMGLAESRMRQKQAGTKPLGDGLGIEAEANAILARSAPVTAP